MHQHRKSISLDPDLVEPLKARAALERRSVTAQINVLIRLGLGMRSPAQDPSEYPPLRDLDTPARPDPRVKR